LSPLTAQGGNFSALGDGGEAEQAAPEVEGFAARVGAAEAVVRVVVFEHEVVFAPLAEQEGEGFFGEFAAGGGDGGLGVVP